MNKYLDKEALRSLTSTIPEHCQQGLYDYIEHGTPTGSFLRAVLSNDLKGAFAYADSMNAMFVREYVQWLYNYAPGKCWGSPAIVEKWLAMHEKRRKEEGLCATSASPSASGQS